MDSINKVKQQLFGIKKEQLYNDILHNKVTLKDLEETTIHFSNMEFFVKLEKILIACYQIHEQISGTLQNILQLKNDESARYGQFLEQVLDQSIELF